MFWAKARGRSEGNEGRLGWAARTSWYLEISFGNLISTCGTRGLANGSRLDYDLEDTRALSDQLRKHLKFRKTRRCDIPVTIRKKIKYERKVANKEGLKIGLKTTFQSGHQDLSALQIEGQDELSVEIDDDITDDLATRIDGEPKQWRILAEDIVVVAVD
jgi:hypothetical protein